MAFKALCAAAPSSRDSDACPQLSFGHGVQPTASAHSHPTQGERPSRRSHAHSSLPIGPSPVRVSQVRELAGAAAGAAAAKVATFRGMTPEETAQVAQKAARGGGDGGGGGVAALRHNRSIDRRWPLNAPLIAGATKQSGR